MMSFNELTGFAAFLQEQMGWQGQLLTAAVGMVIVIRLVKRLQRASAVRRLHVALDLYAERQAAMRARANAAFRRSGTVLSVSPRKSGLVPVISS